MHFNGAMYDILGVCVHSGNSVGSGHFFGYFVVNGSWFLFDDQFDPRIEHVEEPREVLKSLKRGRQGAYGLVYTKR